MQAVYATHCHASIEMRTVEYTAPPAVFIVDPEPSVREMLAQATAQAGWCPVVAASAEEFLARPRAIAEGCLLVEQDLPGIDGLALQRRVAERTELPVIFMSHRADIRTTVEAMKAGALDFLVRPLREEALLHAIGAALELSAAKLDEAARLHRLHRCYQELSRREREVLQLVTAGRLNKQVGFDLGISEITVKAHRGSLMRKMHAGSLAELVGMASDLDCGAERRYPHHPRAALGHSVPA